MQMWCERSCGIHVICKLTNREVTWNGVHLVLKHFSMKSRDVEWLHSVRQATSQHCIHVHTTAQGMILLKLN